MTPERYQFIYSEAIKNWEKPEIAAAIKNLNRLSKIAKEKAKKRYEIEDRLHELYESINIDGIANSILGDEELPENERLLKLSGLWIKDDPKVLAIRNALDKSENKLEISRLEEELETAKFEYFRALIELDSATENARDSLFSDEYKAKMKEYAEKGLLLYYLETPDAPILSDGVTPEDIIESLSFGDFMSLKTLFYHFISEDNKYPSMKRKVEDIVSAIDCLRSGYYRSAARTIFALLESEHKNCSAAMDNYFTLDKWMRKGNERAKKIENLLGGLEGQKYFLMVWNVINPLYKDILDSKTDSFVDRNSIIHGDYYSEKMDLSQNDIIKLLLLFLNMRMISDHIQNHCEIIREANNYLEIHIAQELKKARK